MATPALAGPMLLLAVSALLGWLPLHEILWPDPGPGAGLAPLVGMVLGMAWVVARATSARLRWAMARGLVAVTTTTAVVLAAGGDGSALPAVVRPLPTLLLLAAGLDGILALRRAALDAGWSRPGQSFALSLLLLTPAGAWIAAARIGEAWWAGLSFSFESGDQRVEFLFLMLNTSQFCGGLMLALALVRCWARARRTGREGVAAPDAGVGTGASLGHAEQGVQVP